MRKIKYKKWIDDENLSDFIHDGTFLQWITSAHPGMREFNTAVALIELPDGTVEEVLPSNIKFTTPCNTSAQTAALSSGTARSSIP